MKKPNVLNIAIDSSNLREDRGLNKADMAYLKELAKLKVVKIHIPWFVYKECTTTNTNDLIKELDTASNHLSNPTKKGLHPNEELHFEKIRKAINQVKSRVQTSVEKVWKDFITETSAVLYPFKKEQAPQVFDSYFNGNPPFASRKSRKDIPDAFIYETLKDIAKKIDLHFICQDNNLRKNAESIKNISGYESFDQFFDSEVFKPVKRYYEEYGQTELKKLAFTKTIPRLCLELKTKIEMWQPFELHVDYSFSNAEMITINSIYDVKVAIPEKSIKFIGSEFYVEIEITANASLEYFIDKSEALWMEDTKRVSLSDWNDHVFLAEEEETQIKILHTLILPEEYLKEQFDLEFEPSDIEDEFEFIDS